MSKVIKAFGLDTAARLTGLSRAQLIGWDRTGFFCPSLAHDDRSVPHSRVFNYKDLLALRTLGLLKNRHRISVQHLRKVKNWLGLLRDNDWADKSLFVDRVRRRVALPDDDGAVRDAGSGQQIFEFALGPVREDLERDLEREQVRKSSQFGRFERQRGHVNNRETIAGTRIPVDAVASFLEAGYSDKGIIEQYPALRPADIEAVRRRSIEAA